jgi:hypothetical protein
MHHHQSKRSPFLFLGYSFISAFSVVIGLDAAGVIAKVRIEDYF